MRKLSDNEKVDVKKMLESRWFQIMEELVWEYKTELLEKFTTMPLWEEKTINELTWMQNFLKGINDFIFTIKSSTSWVWKKNDKKKD